MEYILYEVNGAVGKITINREKALNALNSQVLDELNTTLDTVNLDEVRCLILYRCRCEIICCRCRYSRDEHLDKGGG